MAGKECVLASRYLAYALDEVSKNALIDVLVDRARAEIGEDASDAAVANLIEGWCGPAWLRRGDKPVSFVRAMVRLERHEAKYRKAHGL